MYGSWSIFSKNNISVCAAHTTTLTFLFASFSVDSVRDVLNNIILATIYCLLKVFPPYISLTNRFFMPSTSLILLADPNISCWIISITSGIHNEKLWYHGYLAVRYPDPYFLLEISSTTEWRSTERTWIWYPFDRNSTRHALKFFNQGQCYGRESSSLQRFTSSNLLLYHVAFNLSN